MATPAALAAAVALFDRGAYFEAHEVLEPLWLAATGVDREALHGLLQVAVGFHHAVNGNAHGAAALLDRALARLGRCPDSWMGLDLARLRVDSAAVRAAVHEGRLADVVAAGLPRLTKTTG